MFSSKSKQNKTAFLHAILAARPNHSARDNNNKSQLWQQQHILAPSPSLSLSLALTFAHTFTDFSLVLSSLGSSSSSNISGFAQIEPQKLRHVFHPLENPVSSPGATVIRAVDARFFPRIVVSATFQPAAAATKSSPHPERYQCTLSLLVREP